MPNCGNCKKAIKAMQPFITAEYSGPFGDTVDWIEDYHLLCAALDPPDRRDLKQFLRFADLPKPQQSLLLKIVERLAKVDEVRIVWRHPTEIRCVLQLGETHALFYDAKLPLVVEGTLREVTACVPDADFEAAGDAMAKAETSRPPKLQRPHRDEDHSKRWAGL